MYVEIWEQGFWVTAPAAGGPATEKQKTALRLAALPALENQVSTTRPTTSANQLTAVWMQSQSSALPSSIC
jgi:hypothetical protein